METTPENSPENPPLDSIFEELRALPLHPPRREMLAGLGWKSLFQTPALLFFPFLAFICLMLFALTETAKSNRAIDGRATAHVIQVEPIDSPQSGQPLTFLKYRFRHNGRDVTGSALASPDSPLLLLRVGNSFEVAFDKAQPQRSLPAFEIAQNQAPWFFLVLFPLLFAAFLPLFVPQMRTIWLGRRLFARGVLTTGELKFVKSPSIPTPWMPRGSSQLIYEFDDQNGRRQRGAMRCDNSWLTLQLEPQLPVVVAYNPQKPRENIVLEPFVA